MLDMKERQMISKRIDVIIAIREIVEDAMERNPGVSSGVALDLTLEGIQEDVLDGWSPDAE